MVAWRESRRTTSSSCSDGQKKSAFCVLRVRSKLGNVLTGCLNKVVVIFPRQERIWQVAEELLQETSYTVDIMEKVLRVPEIQLWRCCILT